ncbi:MAG: hypothetical protein KDC10_15875 [Calditrichaeota bacterium]|nr:hypothetical protein [Calditrichota bacterium]
MYRLNTLGSGFPKTSSAADTTGWWAGTHAFLDQLSRVNGVAFLNLHPGWTGPCRETCSRDSLYSRSLQLPNGNLIHCRGRQGNTGRNDISAMQLDCILEAMAHWDSLKLASDGVRRLAIVPIEQLMTSSVLPWREDDTSDPDIAVANAWSTLDSLVDSGRSFSGDVALRPRDQVLVHVDGTGSIMAGTGTMDSPLPSTSFNHLFNCSVEFVGHSPGDTLTLEPDPAMRCGNVRFNLNGLTLLAGSSELPLMEYMSSASQGRFLHHIEWVNGTFDFAGNHTTVGVSLGDVATIANPVLRPSDLHFRGITFRAGEDALWLRNVHHPVVDSCFFQALPGVSGGSLIRGGSGLYWPRIRNCVFDLRGAGNQSTALDFGNNSTDNWQDSLAIVNNIYITGTGSHTVIRMPAHANLDSSGVGRKLRLGGSYVISNRSSEPDDLVSGQRLTTLSDLQASVQRNQPGFAWPAAWEPGAWNGFDSVENVSDTLRFGGWTGSGSCQHGLTASIGPVLYTGSVPYVRIHLGAGSTIELEWESVPGAIGYHVYHKDSGNDWHIEATCATTHASMSPTNPLPLGNRFEQYRVRTVFQGPETPSHGLDDRVSPEAD